MTRNLGGSVGIALTSALLTQREHLHSNRIGESVSLFSSFTRVRIDATARVFMSRGFDSSTAHNMAIGVLDRTIRTQAQGSTHGVNDTKFGVYATRAGRLRELRSASPSNRIANKES